jgi:hypothetical protein
MENLDYYEFLLSKQRIHESKKNNQEREDILRWLRDKIKVYFSFKKEIQQREVFFSTIMLFDNYINKSNEEMTYLIATTCLFVTLKMEMMNATYDIDFFVHSIVGFMKHLSFRDIITEILTTEKNILSTMKFDLHVSAKITTFLHVYFKSNNEQNKEIKEMTWYLLELSMYVLPEIKPSLLVLSAYVLSQVKQKIYDSKLLEQSKHNYDEVRKSLKILMNMIKMDNKVYEEYKISVKNI